MNNHVVVTISRQFGAEGHEIAKTLSDRLNIKLYDKDILGKAALEMGSEKTSFSDIDEKLSAHFLKPYLKLSMGHAEINDQLFSAEEQVIRDVASSDSCVIVGRLSGYLLRNEPHVLKVLIHAPFDFRVENIAKKHSISKSSAKKMVRKMDIARKNYCSYYSNGKWQLDKNKDISLNREMLGIEGCVDILEAAFKYFEENL